MNKNENGLKFGSRSVGLPVSGGGGTGSPTKTTLKQMYPSGVSSVVPQRPMSGGAAAVSLVEDRVQQGIASMRNIVENGELDKERDEDLSDDDVQTPSISMDVDAIEIHAGDSLPSDMESRGSRSPSGSGSGSDSEGGDRRSWHSNVSTRNRFVIPHCDPPALSNPPSIVECEIPGCGKPRIYGFNVCENHEYDRSHRGCKVIYPSKNWRDK